MTQNEAWDEGVRRMDVARAEYSESTAWREGMLAGPEGAAKWAAIQEAATQRYMDTMAEVGRWYYSLPWLSPEEAAPQIAVMAYIRPFSGRPHPWPPN